MSNLVESIALMQAEISELRRILGCLNLFSFDKKYDTFVEFSDGTGTSSMVFENVKRLHLRIEELEKSIPKNL